jgi:hypothetical protein
MSSLPSVNETGRALPADAVTLYAPKELLAVKIGAVARPEESVLTVALVLPSKVPPGPVSGTVKACLFSGVPRRCQTAERS